jgi:putative protease
MAGLERRCAVTEQQPEIKERAIGKVSHFFSKISVAAIELTDTLRVGDTIHIKGHTTDFTQKIISIQIEHLDVEVAKAGDSIGVKVDQHAREGDAVFVVE